MTGSLGCVKESTIVQLNDTRVWVVFSDAYSVWKRLRQRIEQTDYMAMQPKGAPHQAGAPSNHTMQTDLGVQFTIDLLAQDLGSSLQPVLAPLFRRNKFCCYATA